MLKTGQQIDRYVVEGRIGEGGMAAVYRVRHVTLGTVAALKVVTTRSREVRRRLLVEGQVQASLKHPHIVLVNDVLEVDDTPCLLMEFIEGPTLQKWLSQYQPTLDEALALFRGIVCGVGHAHATGHIHRDLKPANVMLSLEEHRMVPKVADFGLAKALGNAPLEVTREGATMGTPAFMAPEQIRDSSTVDRRADLWSLGCILYRLVCGVPAFEGDDIIELFNQIANGDFPPTRAIRPGLPDRIHDLIGGLLHTQREGRVADCADLLSFLDGHRDVLTCPEGTLAKAPKPRTDQPTWLEGSGRGIRIARDQFEDAQRRPPKLKRAFDADQEDSVITEAQTFVPRGDGPSLTSAAPDSVMIPPRNPLARWWIWAAGIASVAAGAMVVVVAVVLAFVVLQTSQFALWWAADPPTLADPDPPAVPDLAPIPVPEAVPDAPTAPVPPADPRPVAPSDATVSFTGADQVWLEHTETSAIERNLARIPPGSYSIRAVFPGESASVVAGRIELMAGQEITLRCVAHFSQCRPI